MCISICMCVRALTKLLTVFFFCDFCLFYVSCVSILFQEEKTKLKKNFSASKPPWKVISGSPWLRCGGKSFGLQEIGSPWKNENEILYHGVASGRTKISEGAIIHSGETWLTRKASGLGGKAKTSNTSFAQI